jgi:nucleoside transporter
MKIQMTVRLSAMMFLEYFIWGAWYVTLGTWLTNSLHLSDQQIGWAAGTTAVGAILAPFFIGLIADQYFAAQRLLAALHFAGAVLLFLAARQVAFAPLYGLLLVYCLCFMPTLALTNSLAFRQMRQPENEFGNIRVLGTIGWIVAGLLVGGLRLESTAIPMQIAAAGSLGMALYCLTLPDTPPLAISQKVSLRSVVPIEAVKLLAQRSMAVFAIASLLICIPLQFYYAFTNLFLNQEQVRNAAGKMSGGQMSELFFMLLIPRFFRRLGVKYMLATAMLAWVVRYVFFAFGGSEHLMWMLWGGILLHGVCYDFFFVTGQIYIDSKAPANLRAAAQGLITLITYGLGMLVGSWLSGAAVDHYAHPVVSGVVEHNWHAIWLFSAICSGAVLVFFLLFFRETNSAAPSRVESREIPVLETPLA